MLIHNKGKIGEGVRAIRLFGGCLPYFLPPQGNLQAAVPHHLPKGGELLHCALQNIDTVQVIEGSEMLHCAFNL